MSIPGLNRFCSIISWAATLTAVAPSESQPQTSEGARRPPLEASQFDFLIGDWTFAAVWKTPAGSRTGGGTWTARKAFEGYGIADEWRVLRDGDVAYLGASMRIYDVARGAWHLTFSDVFNGRWEDQFAEFRDGEMHLSWGGWDARGRRYLMRVRYYDISSDHFRWKGDRSYDGGATWIDGWLTMEVTREGTEPGGEGEQR
jgi:hypothetical protein